MDLLPSQEQTEIFMSARAFLAAECPVSSVRELAHAGRVVDRSLWSRAAEQGWFALGVAEDQGGLGYGLPEQMLLCREIGRSLVPGPFAATMLAASVAAASGDRALTDAIVSGAAVVGLAKPVAQAARIADVVEGRFAVFDGQGADLLLLLGRQGSAIIGADAQTDVAMLPCVDATTRLAEASVPATKALAWVGPDDCPVHVLAWVLTAAELVGNAEASRDMSARHAQTRVQFGRPIGTFQAVKHRCANMAVRAEAALQLTSYASLVVALRHAASTFQARSAVAVATDAAVRNAEDNIQNHGGMGFTDQLDAHLYLKRALVRANALGPRREELGLLLDEDAPLRIA